MIVGRTTPGRGRPTDQQNETQPMGFDQTLSQRRCCQLVEQIPASETDGSLKNDRRNYVQSTERTAAPAHVDDNHGNDDCDEKSSMTCPLFMDGLPANFSTHPQLAAIASLLEDTVPEEIAVPNDEEGRCHPSCQHHQQHHGKNCTPRFDSVIQKKKWQRDTIASHYRSQRGRITDGGNPWSLTPRTNNRTAGGGKARPPPFHRRSHQRGFSPYPTTVPPSLGQKQINRPSPNSHTDDTTTTNVNAGTVAPSISASVGEATLFMNLWKL